MLTRKRVGLTASLVALAGLGTALCAPSARAATVSDQGAAIVVWPKVVVSAPAQSPALDTQISLMNLDRSNATSAHCFYVNANSHCANTGAVCSSSSDCENNGIFAPCVPGWVEVDFDINLTPNQPLAWRAGQGLANSDLPCPGGFGSVCSGNQGTRVPPVTERPFIGELKCVQTDPITRLPAECTGATCQNDLAGDATIFSSNGTTIEGKQYNAVGIQTFGDNNGDNELIIGGDQAEYQPCSEVLILNHLFDNSVDPISGVYTNQSELTLVPCTEDFLAQSNSAVTAQFLVFNEFEQRFSTSRQVRCLLDSVLSNIDTSQSDRSVFGAGVAGTVAGQTRIRGVGGGLIGAAVLNNSGGGGSAYNLDGFADRADSDLIRVP